MTTETWILVAAGTGSVALLLVLVIVRATTRSAAEIKIADVVVALVPLVVALFATGQITKLTLGPEGVTVERAAEAIRIAADSGVTDQISKIEPESLDAAAKGSINRIPEYLASGVEALTFQVGGSYAPDIMSAYFKELTMSPRFRYFVLLEGDRLFGTMEAQKLFALVEGGGGFEGEKRTFLNWTDVRDLIKDNPDGFSQFPGYIPEERALDADTTKSLALRRLEEDDADWLPVVDQERRLVGIVERSRLTASLVLEVSDILGEI